ncbi:MAG: sigma-70 family RNA polymerase sigma factor [Acidobacteria bacterium]|nr:sigma-70 family RNA polymerase sigma factor [Acidobacteriota bacterium]
MRESSPIAHDSQTAHFPSSRWSLVVLACRTEPDAGSAEALASLCGSYWYPLYAFARRSGYSVEDAKDLTQGFFARLLEKHYLRDYRGERGRFRTFLLAAFRHYAANEHHRETAQKRGGGAAVLSLDYEAAEGRLCREPIDVRSPDSIFERHWAMAVLNRAFARVESEYAGGRRPCFERLRRFLTGEPQEVPYRLIAGDLGTSEGAVRLAVHRLRRRFREALQAEVAETLSDPAETGEELQFLMHAVTRRP